MPPMAFKGLVTKAGYMNKTATVTVSRFVLHPRTHKRIERSKKYLIHDEKNRLREEDIVIIRNCPPISARKRFTLEKVVGSPAAERELARARKAEELVAEGGSTSQIQQLLNLHT